MFPAGEYVAKPAEYKVPVPSARVFQPLNVNPARTIDPAVASVTATVPVAVTESTLGVPIPPLTSNRMREFHCAYKVMFWVGVNEVPVSYRVPEPFAAVFHPANVYPVLAIVPAVRVSDRPRASVTADGSAPDVAVFESKVIRDPHCAKSVTFAVGV